MSRRWLMAGLLMTVLAALIAPSTRPADAAFQDDAPPGLIVKRLDTKSAEDLRKELLAGVAEAGFGQGHASALYEPLKKQQSRLKDLPSDLGPSAFVQLAGVYAKALPWRMEPDCTLGREAAQQLHALSLHLRDCMSKATADRAKDPRPNAAKVKELLAMDSRSGVKAEEWRKPYCIPTLMQLLQAEDTELRTLLVALLADIKGKEASVALAQRAIFDLSPDIREQAVQALSKRPAAEYQELLFNGLRYPWVAFASHAAEAIVALKTTDLVAPMVKQLAAPPPSVPVRTPQGVFVHELVRINHLCNCMLCHAPSLAKDDLVRGRVPMPGEDPPPLYYNATSGLFVQASTTYLRQDFSVVQPVLQAGKWSKNQRYDYVLRVRPLDKRELAKFVQVEKQGTLKQLRTYEQREATLFALRQVTKRDLGDTNEAWRDGLPKLLMAIREDKNQR